MTKKINGLAASILLLLVLGSCTQTNGDEPVPVCPPNPEPPGRKIIIDRLQYEVYTKDYLYGGKYTRELMIRDFMCDNPAIPDIPTAKKIIDGKIDPWIVPPYPVTHDNAEAATITIAWEAYDAYLASLSVGGDATWDAMIALFMKDGENTKIRDIATATFIMQQQAYFKTNAWNQYAPPPSMPPQNTPVQLNWTGYNSNDAWAKRIVNFMSLNTSIQDVATAEFIVGQYAYFKDNDWIEYTRQEVTIVGTLININWTGYNNTTIWAKRMLNFMRDNPAVPDISTAEYIIQEQIDQWAVPLTEYE